MLTFACVWADRKYGPEYVNILYDMVRRNLPFGTLGRFICYSDYEDELHPGIVKRPWHYELEDEAHYLRLDCCIVRPLDDVLKGEPLRVSEYDGSFPDQVHMIIFPDKKPHECDGWVKHVWKVGGGTSAEMTYTPNMPLEEIQANIRSAISRPGVKWFEPKEEHEGVAIIVGGAPSLETDIPLLRYAANMGQIFAVNGVPAYLEGHGITADFHVMLDAHPDCLKFVAPNIPMQRYYASQCNPEVLDAAGVSLIGWHGGGMAMQAIPDYTFKHVVGGGSTAASRAMVLAYGLGYRKFHLFGLDSSYDGERGHAYDQYNPQANLTVTCGDETFQTTAQMLGQAEDLKKIIPDLVAAECEITVHGAGLLKSIADKMAA